jgi:hypothetical protein
MFGSRFLSFVSHRPLAYRVFSGDGGAAAFPTSAGGDPMAMAKGLTDELTNQLESFNISFGELVKITFL